MRKNYEKYSIHLFSRTTAKKFINEPTDQIYVSLNSHMVSFARKRVKQSLINLEV